LVGSAEIHPGLIILPALDRERTWLLLQTAIEYLERHDEPADFMVNHVLEIDASGAIRFFALPAG
jgi:hypothetical protein